jgi:hypothetical protein
MLQLGLLIARAPTVESGIPDQEQAEDSFVVVDPLCSV